MKDPIENPEEHRNTTVSEDTCYFAFDGCEGGAQYFVETESVNGGACESCATQVRNENSKFQGQRRIKGR